ncbi:shikimate dehydrogenase [Nocardioides sp. Root190]|uniref:shikimate 5-dehydrogenase n=1 Tax=Nocardioides sp. Root190 TaxID=1736488 RepID=UPI0006F82BBC|nr:shikimate 5-dehydrogenase [Nocardioides sp. Root190]KRB77379.1 shikimate dehydrogenase [Nocardioides sp. Root190]
MPVLHKDQQLCVSLAARPSNIGTRFHNFLYDELGLPFVYKAFAPRDLGQAVAGVRGLPIRGASVSMPFKEAVIPLLDGLDRSARTIDSVNTIVNDDGVLTGYNTDVLAVATLLRDREVDPSSSVLLRGSGGMARAVLAALSETGFDDVTVVARNPEAGRALANRYDASWLPEVGDVRAAVLVNATPLGMRGPDAGVQSFDDAAVAAAAVVLDVVAFPADTPLVRAAHGANRLVITGAEVIALQAAEQFRLYTGVTATPEQVERASAFSREVV